MSTRHSVAAIALATLLITAAPVGAGEVGAGRPAPGSYCPLPEKGEVPVCLTPAQSQYRDFFAAIESGQLSDEQAADVEADLAANFETENAYLALSSLSYGYYRLAQSVSQQPQADPALLARLRHWNRLLQEAYGQSAGEPRFRQALRDAAVDLQRRAPPVGRMCARDADPAQCDGSDNLVQALSVIDDHSGVRSPLSQLLDRMLGDEGGPAGVTRPVSGTK